MFKEKKERNNRSHPIVSGKKIKTLKTLKHFFLGTSLVRKYSLFVGTWNLTPTTSERRAYNFLPLNACNRYVRCPALHACRRSCRSITAIWTFCSFLYAKKFVGSADLILSHNPVYVSYDKLPQPANTGTWIHYLLRPSLPWFGRIFLNTYKAVY
jgi:hypothetical protein